MAAWRSGPGVCAVAGKGLVARWRLLAALFGAALAAGCATQELPGKPLDRDGIIALNADAAPAQYRLTLGDRISVKFSYNKELNEDVTVRQDGRISLQGVAEVLAAGSTPEELSRELTRAYSQAFGIQAQGALAASSVDASSPSPPAYVMGIGERISIKSFYHDKLNEDVIIRPDGYVSMQLLGDVKAAGITPSQLAAVINGRLKTLIEAPDIAVIVREFRRPELSVIVRESAAQRIFVGGEVRQAGTQSLTTSLGLMAATLQAGGALESARLEQVVLLRKNQATREPAIYSIDLRSILRGESPDITLKPLDIVFVPKTVAAETAAALRQNIYNMLPSQFVFSLGYQINPTVDVQSK
ncbi:hypothetical protein BH11PSE9_BH11PSE9_20510 [soil metagenome]